MGRGGIFRMKKDRQTMNMGMRRYSVAEHTRSSRTIGAEQRTDERKVEQQ